MCEDIHGVNGISLYVYVVCVATCSHHLRRHSNLKLMIIILLHIKIHFCFEEAEVHFAWKPLWNGLMTMIFQPTYKCTYRASSLS